MEGASVKYDNEVLEYEFNQPAMLSSLSFNSVNQQHTPKGYDTVKSTPADSGNYFRTKAEKTFLGPAPRSQLGVPTNKVYTGNTKKYYKPIISNANWVRGNQFGVHYPYKKNKKFTEVVAIPNINPERSNKIDYLGNNSKIIMRNNDPFYPYPSEHLRKNPDYWGYMHEKQYLNGQPIYNYPYSDQEGVGRGKYYGGKGYDPYEVEQFCCGKESKKVVEQFGDCSNGLDMRYLMVIIVIVILLGLFLVWRK